MPAIRLKFPRKGREKSTLTLLFANLSTLSMVDAAFSFYLFDFYVTTALIPSTTVGYMMLASEFFNVFIGPVSSYLIDRVFVVSIGQHRFWMFLTLPVLICSFMLLWYIPDGMNQQWSLPLYFTALLLLFNTSYGFLLIAYEGCITNMFTEEVDLSRVNSYRLFSGSISSIGVVALGTLLSPLDTIYGGSSLRFQVLAASVCGIIILSYLTFLFSVVEENENTLRQKGGKGMEEASGGREVTLLELPNDGSDDGPQRIEEESPSPTSTTLTSLKKHTQPSYFSQVTKLLRKTPLLFLLLSHFLLWIIIISLHATIQAFVRDYIRLDTLLAPGSTGGVYFTPSTFAVLAMQGGTAASQMLMGIFPVTLHTNLMTRLGLVCVTGGGLTFLFGWESVVAELASSTIPYTLATNVVWPLMILCFITGFGIGGLFTSYEILVPLVILLLEGEGKGAKTGQTMRETSATLEADATSINNESLHESSPTGLDELEKSDSLKESKAVTPTTTDSSEDSSPPSENLENLIYGLVDSIRELSLSLSFLSVGLITDSFPLSGVGLRVCCGLIPCLVCILCFVLHIFSMRML